MSSGYDGKTKSMSAHQLDTAGAHLQALSTLNWIKVDIILFWTGLIWITVQRYVNIWNELITTM